MLLKKEALRGSSTLCKIIVNCGLFWSIYAYTENNARKQYQIDRKIKHTFASDTIRDIAREVIGIHCNIINWDTLKVLITAFPPFIAARMIDEDVQSFFYDRAHHKNIHQLPYWCHGVANWAISIPIGILALQTLFCQDQEFCETNKTCLIGVIFVVSGKVLLKKLNFGFCLRPWHEKFSCSKRATGGFPSGHAAEVTYIALLYGMRYGPKFIVPFSLLALGVAGTFWNCNRHYLSQLVGGAAFGAIYALAANKFIDAKLCKKNITLSLSTNQYGGPSLHLGYSF